MVTWTCQIIAKQIQEIQHNLSTIISSWSALKAIHAGIFWKACGLLPTIGTISLQFKAVCLGLTQHITAYMTSLMGRRVKKHWPIMAEGVYMSVCIVIDGWTLNPDTHVSVGSPNLTMLKVDRRVCIPILSLSLICVKAQLNCLRSFWLTWAQKCSQVVQWSIPPTHTCVGQSYRDLHHSRTSFTSPLPSSAWTESWHLS